MHALWDGMNEVNLWGLCESFYLGGIRCRSNSIRLVCEIFFFLLKGYASLFSKRFQWLQAVPLQARNEKIVWKECEMLSNNWVNVLLTGLEA